MATSKLLLTLLTLSLPLLFAGNSHAAQPDQVNDHDSYHLTVADIADREVIGKNGKSLGNIESVFASSGEQFVMLGRAGFLGFAGTDIALPISLLSIIDDQIVAPMISEEHADRIPAHDFSHIQTLTNNDVVTIDAQ